MRRRKVTYLSPFYGYPPEQIAQWCCVSVQTARAYKNGSKRPSKSVLKLFRLTKKSACSPARGMVGASTIRVFSILKAIARRLLNWVAIG
jgi:hypothetical protein